MIKNTNTNTFSARTYTIGGSAVKDGVAQLTVGTGKLNVKRNIMKFHQYVDINLIELPRAMDRVEAIAYLIETGYNGIVGSRAKDKSQSRVLDAAKARLAALAPIGVKVGEEVFGPEPMTFSQRMAAARAAKAARLAAEAVAA
jgi:hypothetical protein